MFSSPLNVGGLPTYTECWGRCGEAMRGDGEGPGLLRDEGEEGGGETARRWRRVERVWEDGRREGGPERLLWREIVGEMGRRPALGGGGG